MVREEGFEVYFLNEFKTSSLCPVRNDGTKLETFKKTRNHQLFRGEKTPIVTCHGLLRCTNKNCLGSPGRRRLLNRDMAAVLNFRHILLSLKENNEKPTRFLRNPNNNNEPSVTAATILPTTRPSMTRKAPASSSVAGSSRKK